MAFTQKSSPWERASGGESNTWAVPKVNMYGVGLDIFHCSSNFDKKSVMLINNINVVIIMLCIFWTCDIKLNSFSLCLFFSIVTYRCFYSTRTDPWNYYRYLDPSSIKGVSLSSNILNPWQLSFLIRDCLLVHTGIFYGTIFFGLNNKYRNESLFTFFYFYTCFRRENINC